MSIVRPTNDSHEQMPKGYTVADIFLEALAEGGVDYIFTVLGSDHPSIIEAYLKRQRDSKQWPRMLLFLHEMVAISAADAYARVTRKAQCVLVHVDVGTAALGQGLHNASSGKAPVLIFAGQAPSTLHGEQPGSRSEHVQWYQDCANQAAIVQPYSRYSNEIKTGDHARMMVHRALLMASTGPCGPTYLTATREVLAAEARADESKRPLPTCSTGGLPTEAVETIAETLLSAEHPLVVTGYLGRNHRAVFNLVELANIIKGLQVFDSEFREMSFPATHRSWITRSTGAAQAIKHADCILVLDADVPWIPTKARPFQSARIFHIDVDPRKERMQLFDIFAEGTFNAKCDLALQQLCEYIKAQPQSRERQDVFNRRWDDLGAAHAKNRELLSVQASAPQDGTISSNFLFASLRHALPPETVYVHDVVTNQAPLSHQLQLSTPGSNYSKGGSGLGWAGGAAIGVRLALDRYDTAAKPDIKVRDPSDRSAEVVCCLSGDGSFIFGAPSAVYWAQHRLQTPFLSIVVNNGGWKATRSCINDVHPNGIGAKTSDGGLGIDLQLDGPDYVGIAVAASNGHLWGRSIGRAEDLVEALKEAIGEVRDNRRGALLEVIVN